MAVTEEATRNVVQMAEGRERSDDDDDDDMIVSTTSLVGASISVNV
jgi:hypothetical protein